MTYTVVAVHSYSTTILQAEKHLHHSGNDPSRLADVGGRYGGCEARLDCGSADSQGR